MADGAIMTKRTTLPRRVPAASADTLGLVLYLHRSNEYLLDVSRRARAAAASARGYLATPGCNRTLGETALWHAETRRHAALRLLRANRIKVRDLVGSAA